MACIYRKKDRWIVDYRVGLHRKRPSFANKAEAEAFKRDLLLRPIDEVTSFIKQNVVPVDQAIKQYLELVTAKKAERTRVLEEGYFKGLGEYFKGRALSDINLQEIEKFQLHLSKKLEASTVNRYFNTIRHFFRKCEDWEFIRRNPTARLANLKAQVKVKKIWTDEDIQKVINFVDPWVADAIFFIAKTGVRRGEAISLTWPNVDFDEKTIFIKFQKGGQWKLRPIPMTGELFQFFINKRNQTPRTSEFVFLDFENKRISDTTLSTQMHRAAKKCKLPGMGLHGLRHSILTKLAASDYSLEKIRQLAGHSNLRTTEQYLHLNREDLRKSLEEFEGNSKITRGNFGGATKVSKNKLEATSNQAPGEVGHQWTQKENAPVT